MYYNRGSHRRNFHADRGWLMEFYMAQRFQKDKTLNKTHHVLTLLSAIITERCTIIAAHVVQSSTSTADGSFSLQWCQDYQRTKLWNKTSCFHSTASTNHREMSPIISAHVVQISTLTADGSRSLQWRHDYKRAKLWIELSCLDPPTNKIHVCSRQL